MYSYVKTTAIFCHYFVVEWVFFLTLHVVYERELTRLLTKSYQRLAQLRGEIRRQRGNGYGSRKIVCQGKLGGGWYRLNGGGNGRTKQNQRSTDQIEPKHPFFPVSQLRLFLLGKIRPFFGQQRHPVCCRV